MFIGHFPAVFSATGRFSMGDDYRSVRIDNILFNPLFIAGGGQFFQLIFSREYPALGFTAFLNPPTMRESHFYGNIQRRLVCTDLTP
jgi:hypothetical protein